MIRRTAWLLVLVLGACTAGPEFHHPSVFAPSSWFTQRPVQHADGEPVDPRWWRALNDPVLTGLMERLAASNLGVAAATARLAQSRAARTVTGGAQNPALDAGAGYDRDRLSRYGPLKLLPDDVTQRARRPFDLFDAGFDASWELDLWGRVRRGVEAVDAGVEASADERRAVLVTALAELARNYIALRRVQGLLAVTSGIADAMHRRANDSLARAQAGLIAARLPALRAEAAFRENAIALLLAAAPGATAGELGTTAPAPPVPPRAPLGVPSQLVQRRPDVRAAEARLHAATAGIGVAEADFFPRITLSGSVGVQALQPKYLGSLGAVAFSAGPSLSIPLFEGGRLKGQLELRRAEQQEAAIAFQAATLGAFHDVDNALTAYTAEWERWAVLLDAAADARRAAANRSAAGELTLLEAETELADSTAALATDFVQLYKALGGGWETEFPLPNR